MTDTNTAETPTSNKPGRKTDPVTEPLNQWKKAKLRADKARLAKQRVESVHEELNVAVKAEQEAYDALQQALDEQRS